MRITGGDLKGRTINFPAGIKERPTSDFLRETLFNLLPPVADKNFLDLFAGSGGVGLEAASRGARYVYLIERNKKLAGVIRNNIKSLALDEKCAVINLDVETSLIDLAKKNYQPGIIFADPPYNRNLVSSTLACLGRYQVLDEKGMIVIQHSVKENYQEFLPENIYQVKQRKYGENMVTFFKRS
ncbi:MAG: 16S rRNA (guanine(966)-N(2))-methyltransferase RsmD [Syntrophaceae bacterium]|nr:16S rRNA (guanine(966)-N(2))-methyltransferase RsmD [Syntrophaceae bacterium]